MRLNKEALCKLIPHAGSMCLLDSVEYWDENRIICHTRSHLSLDNPLRRDDQLSLVNAIEYGAQGMAVHGGLLAQSGAGLTGAAYLASLKEIEIENNESLDNYYSDLVIEAKRVFADAGNLVYDFSVSADQSRIMNGQALVIEVETSL